MILINIFSHEKMYLFFSLFDENNDAKVKTQKKVSY